MKNAMTVTSLWLTCNRQIVQEYRVTPRIHLPPSLSLSLSHTHTHTNTWIHAYSRWHDYTNTHLLSVDSWVWPKLPRRGRLLCWRTRTFQRWIGTNTCPGWSQGAWRSNQNTNQIQSQELEECSTYNVHILFIFHYNSTSTILFRNGFVSLSSDRINFMKSL